MPTTLKGVAEAEVDFQTRAIELAQLAAAAAQKAITAPLVPVPPNPPAPPGAQAKLDDDLDKLKKLDDAIAANTLKLAAAVSAPIRDALALELTEQAKTRRHLVDAIANDTDALKQLLAQADFANARLARAKAQLTAAQAALDSATDEDTRRTDWKAAALAAPLVTLRAQATDVVDGTNGSTLLADAEAKFTTGPTKVPQELLDAARDRYNQQKNRLALAKKAVTTAETALNDQANADTSLGGTAQKKLSEFRRGEAAFGDWVTGAKARFDRASGLLQAIANLGTNVFALTPEEAAKANDAGLLAARQTAAGKETATVTPLKNLDQASANLDDVVMNAQAADPNADVSAAPAVIAAEGLRDTAQTAFTTVDGPHDAAKPTLASWQVCLPDITWQRILDFLDAKAELTELKAADPVTLASDLVNQEDAAALAVDAVAKNTRTLDYYEDVRSLRAALFDAAQAALSTRLFSGVRGDSN